MNPVLIYISPLLILLFAASLTFATTTNLQRNRVLAFVGLGTSMVLNTLFLIYPTEILANLESDLLSTNTTNLWIVELILMIGFYNFLAVDTELKDTQSKPLVSGVYLLFLAMIVGIFLTENFLFIVVFFIIASILLNSFYYFGDRKQLQSRSMLRIHSTISGVSYLILVFAVFLMYFEVQSFDFNIFLTYFPSTSQSFQILFALGCFLGFGLPTGMIFLTGFHFRKYFDKANSIFLRLRFSLYVPLSVIVLIRILAQIPYDPALILLNIFFQLTGLLGVLMFSFMIIVEIFGISRHKTRSLPKILGLLGLLQGNLLLLLGLGLYSSGEYVFLILAIIFGNLFLVESLSRIFDKNATPDLQDVRGLQKIQPYSIILLIMALCILICPGFFGFQYMSQILSETLSMSFAYSWINVGSFLLMAIVELMVIGTLLIELFLKPKKIDPSLKISFRPLDLMVKTATLFAMQIFWTIFVIQLSGWQIFLNWL
jgi:lipid-A-disaccharide synthase-like uncharacterized protein